MLPNVKGCPSVCGLSARFETGSLPKKASVLPMLAKAGSRREPARRGFARGRAAVSRFYGTAEDRSATVQRDAPHLCSPEPLPEPAHRPQKKI